MADLFLGCTGGPTAGAWFDGNDATVGSVLNNSSTTWDCGSAVGVESIRVKFTGTQTAKFYLEGTNDDPGGSPTWTQVLSVYGMQGRPPGTAFGYVNLAGTVAVPAWDPGGAPGYPASDLTFPLGATASYRHWRFTIPSDGSGNADIGSFEGIGTPGPQVSGVYVDWDND